MTALILTNNAYKDNFKSQLYKKYGSNFCTSVVWMFDEDNEALSFNANT